MSCSAKGSEYKCKWNELKKLQNLRMAKSCAIVVACTVICFLPFAVMGCLERNIFVTMFMEPCKDS